ncbi:hypothetical protein JQM68_00835 [Oscillibacter valericigenes]|uniref:C97 family peptidase n=1 Tax=Oscillibacter valericigenes TaxID=351091 RepID=UPI001F48F129|nr:C97 family peptidase [Oscillibacter valericigenes]MCF2615742.1 hypothetical protein [Oscillibacter valericigenes]
MSHMYAEPAQEQQRETASSDKQTETLAPSRPPVVCAAPPGAPQGGLLDWFREKFSKQEQPDEGQQWEENEYGEVNPAYVTDKPDPGSPLAPMVQNYTQEGPGQAPVFETHSFMPSASVDNESAMHLHSFIGLRFTQLDPVTTRYTRKRLKVGFGGGGKPVADHGKLMDDSNTQADMSSETPITRDQLESVMMSIPDMAKEPYNVVAHNCNHFTQAIAAMVGATIPAQLHDTVLGPAGAYKNLANAAEQGQQGRTRFFQGGGMGSGRQSQMAGGQESKIITDFEGLAQSAARWDGLPFLLYPSLKNAAQQVAQAAAPMGRFLNSGFSIESPADADALEAATDTAAEKADELIKLRLWKGHPRVNITAMKVIAMAERLHSTFLPEKRAITSYSQQELDASLHQRTKQEEDAQKEGKKAISNQSLFVFGNTSLTGAGDIFLQSMGLMPIDLIQQHTMGTGKPLVRCVALLRQVAGALTGEDGMGVNNYLISFFQGRENLTNAQLGALATQTMLDVLSLKATEVNSPLAHDLQLTRNNAGRIAADRDDDSLDNESNEYTRGTILNFTGKRNAPQNENQRSYQENKQHLLDLVNTMEVTFATKFEAVRARAAAESAEQSASEG